MNKQEEIREGVAKRIAEWNHLQWKKISDTQKEYLKKEGDFILQYLHSQGCVIKVEDNSFVAECLRSASEEIKQDMKEAGYTLWAPLK